MSKKLNKIIAAFASFARRTRRLITLRRVVKVLLWSVLRTVLWGVGFWFFLLATQFIQGSLMLAAEGGNDVLIMLFAFFPATEIAGNLAKRVSAKRKLGAISILVLATFSVLIWIAFIPLGNSAEGWLQTLTWSVGFLLGGAGWVATVEQTVNIAFPKNTPPPTTCERCSGG